MDTPVTRILDAVGVPYQLHIHSRDVFTVEEAAAERGVRPDQIVKVMLVRRSDHTLLAVLVPGHRRLSLKKLSQAIGDKRLTLATPTEIQAATGYTIGAISPLGLPAGVPIYADAGIAANPIIAISAGRHDAGLTLASAALLAILTVPLSDLAV